MEAPPTLTITDRPHLEQALSELAKLERQHIREQAALESKIANLREKYYGAIADRAVEIDAYRSAIEEYAIEHSGELLAGQKTQTLKLPAGELKYAKGRRRVEFTAHSDDVCAQLHKAGRGDLVVMTERPDKSAIGKLDVPPVPGIEFVEPSLTVSVRTY
jgi:phage host-nuclease inhibitor protein Gam